MKIVAVVCSDLHFSCNPPAARSAEPDWYQAMKRSIDELRGSVEEYDVPLIVAGDFFDKWNPNPELVNFLLDWFPSCYCIVGQHDIAYHRYDSMYKTAYGTLVRAGKIRDLTPGEPNLVGERLAVWAFPWGYELSSLTDPVPGRINLAVCHRYVWTNDKNCFPGAPQEANLACLKDKLVGYDAAVFGDNHKGFAAKSGSCNVLNCGGFMARKSDERDYAPSFGLLKDDGSIERIFFDVSEDKWIDPKDEAALIDDQLNLSVLIGELESLGCDALNFIEIIERYLDKEKVDENVRRLVIQALEKGREEDEA